MVAGGAFTVRTSGPGIGGVLTTPVWDSFSAFCRSEGLQPGAIKHLFRSDPAALAELRGLETGTLTEAEFEKAFGGRLGLKNPDGTMSGFDVDVAKYVAKELGYSEEQIAKLRSKKVL